MRANWIENTSTTGGTGALTLSAVTGAPGYTDAFGATGDRTVGYQILEYTDSTRAELVRCEAGVGTVAGIFAGLGSAGFLSDAVRDECIALARRPATWAEENGYPKGVTSRDVGIVARGSKP